MTATRTPPPLSRRELLHLGGAALLGLGFWPGAAGRRAQSSHESPGNEADSSRWGWHLDATGDGHLDGADQVVVEAALGQRRGSDLAPLAGWDPRADVLGAGEVDERALAALRHAGADIALPRRPMVTCFHYGWYRDGLRRGGHPTVVYRGGPYASGNRFTEERFNRLKNEFGIGADLLSWIDRPDVLGAYERGYLSASNLSTRRFGLLFETVINLGAHGIRLRFGGDSPVSDRLADGFGDMGAWAHRAVHRYGARPLEIDGRPVVYLFASHLFGSTDDDLPWIGPAIARARERFADAFGAPPWLIGEESPFPHDDGVSLDRAWRARWLDAVTRYHHYDERQARALAPSGAWRLDAEHRARLVANERRAMEGFRGIDNEFTGRPVLVVPSSAAGFAKRGMPTLKASEADYLALLRDSQRLIDGHVGDRHVDALRDGSLPFPLVLVGSWNEEFEGHALLPASFNQAMIPGDRRGFEWLWAIRRLYGWNHWAGDVG